MKKHNSIPTQCQVSSSSSTLLENYSPTDPSPVEDLPETAHSQSNSIFDLTSILNSIMDFASSFGFSLIAAPQDSNLSSRSRSRDSADFFNETPLLWFANINHESLEENSSQWRMILNKLSEEEKKKVNRFIFHADRKRALLSILLQRAAVHETFDYRDFDDYKIHRTRENKPFLFSPLKSHGRWNYNVSHHGDFVGIVTHHHALVGMDIVDTGTRSQGVRSCREYIAMFATQLTPLELSVILAEPDEESCYDVFFLHWSLKEAFIKAVGQGLGYNLRHIEFTIAPSEDHCKQLGGRKIARGCATVAIQGTPRPDWRFEYFALDDRHVATISEGPVHEALPTFQEAAWGKVFHPISPCPSLAKGPVEVVSTLPHKMFQSKTEYIHVDEVLEFIQFEELYSKVFLAEDK